MSVAPRLQQFLDRSAIPYQLIRHRYAETARSCAEQSRVPAQRLAKAVVLKDRQGFVVAVLPASRSVDLQAVGTQLGRHFTLADQTELKGLFTDCTPGAVPAFGQAYDLAVVWDQSIADEPACCIEAGDHRGLICMSRNSFVKLMEAEAAARICY